MEEKSYLKRNKEKIDYRLPIRNDASQETFFKY